MFLALSPGGKQCAVRSAPGASKCTADFSSSTPPSHSDQCYEDEADMWVRLPSGRGAYLSSEPAVCWRRYWMILWRAKSALHYSQMAFASGSHSSCVWELLEEYRELGICHAFLRLLGAQCLVRQWIHVLHHYLRFWTNCSRLLRRLGNSKSEVSSRGSRAEWRRVTQRRAFSFQSCCALARTWKFGAFPLGVESHAGCAN